MSFLSLIELNSFIVWMIRASMFSELCRQIEEWTKLVASIKANIKLVCFLQSSFASFFIVSDIFIGLNDASILFQSNCIFSKIYLLSKIAHFISGRFFLCILIVMTIFHWKSVLEWNMTIPLSLPPLFEEKRSMHFENIIYSWCLWIPFSCNI